MHLHLHVCPVDQSKIQTRLSILQRILIATDPTTAHQSGFNCWQISRGSMQRGLPATVKFLPYFKVGRYVDFVLASKLGLYHRSSD